MASILVLIPLAWSIAYHMIKPLQLKSVWQNGWLYRQINFYSNIKNCDHERNNGGSTLVRTNTVVQPMHGTQGNLKSDNGKTFQIENFLEFEFWNPSMVNHRSEQWTHFCAGRNPKFPMEWCSLSSFFCVIVCHRKLLISHLNRSDFECMCVRCACMYAQACAYVSLHFFRVVYHPKRLQKQMLNGPVCVFWRVCICLAHRNRNEMYHENEDFCILIYGTARHGIHTHVTCK